MRPTYAEIDLKAIHHNLKQVRKQIGKHPQIMAVVKANAYGHGMIPVAKFVLKESLASHLGVAIVEEGITLRQNGIEAPVAQRRASGPGRREMRPRELAQRAARRGHGDVEQRRREVIRHSRRRLAAQCQLRLH